jgi:predicted anti-sigma-YlaC factor YlaD
LVLKCSGIEPQLVHYLYCELSEAEALEVTNHLKECDGCRSELESLKRTFEILNEFKEVSPTEELRKRLKERIERQRGWIELGNHLLREELSLRIAFSVVFGIIAVVTSVFTLTRNLPLNNIEPRVLLVCGIIWSGTYIALFGLVFYRRTKGNWLGREISSHLPNIAQHALLSIAIATILTSFILALELNGVTDFKTHFINLFWEFHRGWVYLIIGGAIALISFLTSCLLLIRKLKEQSLVHVLLAGCLFTVAIAPGLTIFCVPFMLGTYLSLLSGTGLGVLTGGVLGYRLFRRKFAYRST